MDSIFPQLINVQRPVLNSNSDRLVWIDQNNAEVLFFVGVAWEAIRDREDEVP